MRAISYPMSGNFRRRSARVGGSGCVSDEREAASVGGSVSVSDRRAAGCVGDLRERSFLALRAPLWPALPAPRVPPTNSLTPTLTPTRPAIRGPASPFDGGREAFP